MQEAAAHAVVAEAGDGRLLASAPEFIDQFPIGIYACDVGGRLRWFDSKAAEIWGRRPQIGDDSGRFCGSHKVFSLDGTLLRRDKTPMASALRTGGPISGQKATVERPDGTRITAMVHIKPIKDERGHIIGAINCFSEIPEAKLKHRNTERADERPVYRQVSSHGRRLMTGTRNS